jgi:hypothetical protein
MTPYSIVSYINVCKAKCKKMRHKGRLVKRYEVKGTKEFEEIMDLRKKLSISLGIIED